MRLRVEISGMHCASCVSAVETAVRALPGVREHQVAVGTAAVVFDEAATSIGDVLAAVRGAGDFEVLGFSTSA